MTQLVIVDNDAGIDDAWCLNFLLNSNNNIKILAITCVNGNCHIADVCQNNLYFLKIAGKNEVPVYRGAEAQLIPESLKLSEDLRYFHGVNGFGDVELPKLNEISKIKEENAVAALHRITSELKGVVTLICCGPLTNVALALRTYPDFKFNVKEIFIMGGNHTGMGNTTMSAEFNFLVDPEAAHIVLSEMPMKITLLPWETCLATRISYEWREQLEKTKGRVMTLLNIIEKPIISRMKKMGYQNWVTCDQLLAAIFIDRRIVTESQTVFATVELTGSYTRGQLVIDHLGSKPHNITLIKQIDTEAYKEMVLKLKDY